VVLEDRYGPAAEAAFVRLITSRLLGVVDLTEQDWRRCVELIETYDQLGLGLVDASIVAVAERLGLTEVATMNTRDFGVVRPAHIEAFTQLPSTGLPPCDLGHTPSCRCEPLRTVMYRHVPRRTGQPT
jgi:hypothetical protein